MASELARQSSVARALRARQPRERAPKPDGARKNRIPRRMWIAARRIVGQPAEAAAAVSKFPAELRHELEGIARGVFVHETIDVRTGVVRREKIARRSWANPRARRIVATAWLLYHCSRQRGDGRLRTTGVGHGLIARVLGVSVSSVRATVHKVHGPRRGRGRRGGRTGDGWAGNCGYLRALEQARILRAWQPPASCVFAADAGPVRADGTQWAFVQVHWPLGLPPPL